MRTIQDMAQQEVFCCMTTIVFTLANANPVHRKSEVGILCAEAKRIIEPVPDYEEAAIQAGWKFDEPENEYRLNDTGDGAEAIDANKTWKELCEFHGIAPYGWEVYECWAVSQWFHDELKKRGARVSNDFGSLCVWGRTNTGQAIHADGVVEEIYKSMMGA